MRNDSDDEDSLENQLSQMFPAYLQGEVDLVRPIEQLQLFYDKNKDDPKKMKPVIDRLTVYVFACPNFQVIETYREFCTRNNIGLVEREVTKFHLNSSVPSVREMAKALAEKKAPAFPHIPPFPENFEQILNQIFLMNGCIPNMERLLLSFPCYLQKLTHLQTILMEDESPIQQPLCYFLAVLTVAQTGCLYLLKRLSRRFLEVGGQSKWLMGNYPQKMAVMAGVCWKVAYAPWSINKEQVGELMAVGWTYQELSNAFAIVSLYMQLATFCHATGILQENDEAVADYPFNFNYQIPVFESTNPKQHKTEFKTQDLNSMAKTFLLPEDQQYHHANSFLEEDESNQYLTVISDEIKYMQTYKILCEKMEEFIVNSTDIPEKRDLHKYPTIEYSQYNFKFFSYPFLNNISSKLADAALDLIDYCKDMTRENFGHININTVAFRRAIRYYCENLLGLYHLSYNYKSNLSTFLSKQLKYFMKLLCLLPYLMCQSVVNYMPHQQNQLGYFDFLHASLLVCVVKFQFGFMMLCRALHQYN